jgi:hypothetical protein
MIMALTVTGTLSTWSWDITKQLKSAIPSFVWMFPGHVDAKENVKLNTVGEQEHMSVPGICAFTLDTTRAKTARRPMKSRRVRDELLDNLIARFETSLPDTQTYTQGYDEQESVAAYNDSECDIRCNGSNVIFDDVVVL